MGERRGLLIVWLFFTLYLTVLPLFSVVTTLTFTNLVIQTVEVYGVLLVFLIIFIAIWEKQRSLKGIFSSLGIKRTGIIMSIFWSLALFPLLIASGLAIMLLSQFLGPPPTLGSGSQQIPVWYIWYQIISSFFPVAIVEEAFARGYMLDRLAPKDSSNLVKAVPSILLSSLLFTLYHLPTYLRTYAFQISWICLQSSNVFLISVVLGTAYLRAKTKNIAGPVLVHFILDAMPIILLII